MSDLVNFSKIVSKKVKNKFRNHNEISFQHPCSALICGFTGSGKSNLLLNLLLNTELKMTYDKVILICPSIDEDSYQFLQKYYDEMQSNYEKKTKMQLGYKVFTHISKAEDIPKPEAFDKRLQTIVIVDDFCTNKAVNKKIEDFIIMCRKYNTSLIYLTQSYFEVPKLIRLQMANGYVALFHPPSLREIGQYMLEFSLGITKEEFIKIFNEGTKKRYTPLIIDFKSRGTKWMFRRGLTEPLGVDEKSEGSDDEKLLAKDLIDQDE